MIFRLCLLGLALVSWVTGVQAQAAGRGAVTTTVYVGRHFEVRDQDQPTKYVFNQDTRVASITGSLAARARMQRWRLQPGWNLVSLAVTASNLPAQLNAPGQSPTPLVQALYQWQPDRREYAGVAAGATVKAGAVLWINASTSAVISVTGDYSEPVATSLEPGGGYVAAPGLERGSPSLPAGVTVWKHEAATGTWRPGFSGDLASLPGAPPGLAPGGAVYVHAYEPVNLEVPPAARRILYYHPDHLGSPAVVADADGRIVRESAYYPFGAVRHEERFPDLEVPHEFAQKEADAESGLVDFGHRFLIPGLGRWLNPDPLLEKGGGINPYAYVNQNPFKFEDPDGARITVTQHIDYQKRIVTYKIHLTGAFIDSQQTKFSQQERAQFLHLMKCQIAASFTGSAKDKQRIGKEKKPADWKFQWSTTMDIRMVDKWSEIKKDEHAYRIVEYLPGARGETKNGGMLISLWRDIYNPPPGVRTAEETASHETGHAAGLGHDNRKPNLMMEGNKRPFDTGNVDLYKIQSIFEAYSNGRLNQREPERERLDTSAGRNP